MVLFDWTCLIAMLTLAVLPVHSSACSFHFNLPQSQGKFLAEETGPLLPARGRNWSSFMWDQSLGIKQNSQRVFKHLLNQYLAFSQPSKPHKHFLRSHYVPRTLGGAGLMPISHTQPLLWKNEHTGKQIKKYPKQALPPLLSQTFRSSDGAIRRVADSTQHQACQPHSGLAHSICFHRKVVSGNHGAAHPEAGLIEKKKNTACCFWQIMAFLSCQFNGMASGLGLGSSFHFYSHKWANSLWCSHL